MKKKLFVAIFGGVIVLSSCVVHSPPPHQPQPHNVRTHHQNKTHNKHYVIQHRIDHQERAIHEGMRSGKLTRKEGRTLRHNIAKIKSEYERAKRTDRYVSYKERDRLDHMLDHNDRMIRKLRGNDIRRF